MARVSFTNADGEEKSYKLLPSRVLRIGRDPGSDIILRDAKVSRTHAEIVFERGFFVLHDLASANGTYVNGTRIRVAPLTDGAQLKLGNTFGRFSEEISEGPQPTMMANVAPPLPQPAQTDDVENAGTADHPKMREGAEFPLPTMFDGTSPRGSGAVLPFPVSMQTSEAAAEPHSPEPPQALELNTAMHELLALRRSSGEAEVFFRRPNAVIGLVTNILAGLVSLSGAAVCALFLTERLFFPAALALLLGVVFAGLILALAPRRVVTLYEDEALSEKVLRLRQDDALPVPLIRYTLYDAAGQPIAGYRRNRLRLLLPRRWTLHDPARGTIGVAEEQSAVAPLLRLITANFVRTFRPAYSVLIGGRPAAIVDRSSSPVRVQFERGGVDPRIITGFSVLVGAIDR